VKKVNHNKAKDKNGYENSKKLFHIIEI